MRNDKMKNQEQSEDKLIIGILKQLPAEYVRKVRIYAETLLEIFKNKR